MGAIATLLKSPITEILGSVGDIIGRFVTNPEEKLKAQLELTKVSTDFQLKLASIDGEWAKTQAEVIVAETKSESWLARNWRPILMLTFTYIIFHTYVLVPVFGITAVVIPGPMWELLKIGVGGYVVGRSAEKIVPQVAEVMKK